MRLSVGAPAGLFRGCLLPCGLAALGGRGLGLSFGTSPWFAQAEFGCASRLYFPWLSAGRLGSVVRLRSEEKTPGCRPGRGRQAASLTRVLRGEKVRKTLILLGFLRGLHGAMSKSFRLVVLCLKSCPKTLESE